MDKETLAVLNSLRSGGGIVCHGQHVEVAPVWPGCDWQAYEIDYAFFNQLYLSGLITEHYEPDTFKFQFYDISPTGELIAGTVLQ